MLVNYLDIPNNANQSSHNKVHILPVPYEKTTSYLKGTSGGPEAILIASSELEMFDIEVKKDPYQDVQVITDTPFPTNQADAQSFISELKNKVTDILDSKSFPIILGGEHTISLAPFLAANDKFSDLSVLHFDAHTDLRDSYDNDPYSHACVMRRIREHTSNTVSVGIRSLPKDNYELIQQEKIAVYFMEEGLGSIPPSDQLLNHLTDNVYITIDLDCLDPSIMPSVGTPEPGGMNWYQLTSILKDIFLYRNVVGCDIVELKPGTGHEHADFTAAKLIHKLITYKFCL